MTGNRSLALLAVVFALCSCADKGTNYYFDPAGNDSNAGTSAKAPLRSLSAISRLNIVPGDSILLKSGAVFTEKLYFSGKGSAEKPVVIGKYGGKEYPHLAGDASELQMLHIYNSEHLVVRDLEVSNKGPKIRPHLSGVLLEIYNYGCAADITLDNLYIHDVFGSLIKGEGMEHPDAGGGQAMKITSRRDDNTDTILSWFDGLIVENCHIKDCQRNGIIMWGNWARNEWRPSLNVVFRHNLLEGVPGDGIVPTACDGALVEYNIMRDCPATLPSIEACDGIWPFSSDNTMVRFNVVSGHKSKTDGYAYDSDYNSRNSTFKYNLSYDNEGGALLLCNSGGWPEDWSAGNVGTVFSWNVSINDGIRDFVVADKKDDYFSPVIHITGPVKDSRISNNIFIVPKKALQEMDHTIVNSDDWRGFADSTFFTDNSILVEDPNVFFTGPMTTHNFFKGNVYSGPLKTPTEGFEEHFGTPGMDMWYRGDRKELSTLIDFLKDKKIPYEGEERYVLDILGYKPVPDKSVDKVAVNPDSTLASRRERPAGINLDFFMDGGRFKDTGRPIEESIAEINTGFLRYPGGDKSDLYLFSKAPYMSAKPSVARTIGMDNYPGMFTDDGQYVFDPLDFDEYIALCRAVKAEPVVVVAADSYLLPPQAGRRPASRRQLLEHAVAWVRYANVTKGYGVKYWMIGNECWNPDNVGSTPEIYAHDVIDFSKEMKAVDPTILIVPNGNTEQFFKTVITVAGDYIDRLCVSNYGVMDFYDGYDSYKDMPKDLAAPARTALNAIDKYATPEQKSRYSLIVAEYGTIDWFGHWQGTNDLGHALVNFDMTGQLLDFPDVEFACFWNTRWVANAENVADHDALYPDGKLTPTGLSLSLWNDHCGDRMIPADSDGSVVAYASASSADGRIYLYLINKASIQAGVRISFSDASRHKVQSCIELHGKDQADTAPVISPRRGPDWKGAVTLSPTSVTVIEYI